MTVLDGTITEAIEALAKRAADLRTRPTLVTEKRAAGLGDFLRPLGDAVSHNPELGGALMGSGVGALGGGLHAALVNRQRDPADRKSVLGSALTGGLAGGALGGGAGLAYRGLQRFTGQPQGLEHGDALHSNEYVDPETGQRMQIDAGALKNHPDLPKRLRELGTPNISTTAGGAVLSGLERLHQVAPWTTTAAGVAAPIDALLHNPLFGLARRGPENIGGKIGRNILSRGATAAKDLPSVLRESIMGNTPTGGEAPIEHPPKSPGGQATYTAGKRITANGQAGGKGVLDLLGGKATKGRGTGMALEIEHTPTEEVTRQYRDPLDPDVRSTSKLEQPKGISKHKLNWGQLGQLKSEGLEGSRWADRQLYQVPGTRFSYGGAKSLGRALGGRAALYGLPIAGEWLLRGGLEDIDKHDQIRQLVSQYAKPVR